MYTDTFVVIRAPQRAFAFGCPFRCIQSNEVPGLIQRYIICMNTERFDPDQKLCPMRTPIVKNCVHAQLWIIYYIIKITEITDSSKPDSTAHRIVLALHKKSTWSSIYKENTIRYLQHSNWILVKQSTIERKSAGAIEHEWSSFRYGLDSLASGHVITEQSRLRTCASGRHNYLSETFQITHLSTSAAHPASMQKLKRRNAILPSVRGLLVAIYHPRPYQ